MPKTVLELKTNAFLLNDLFKESNHYKESIVRDIFYFTLNKPIYIPSIYKLSSNGQYVYHGEKRAYPFYVFSDFVNDEKLKQQLQTMERTKKCHDFALQFTLGEEGYKIVTGYVNLFNKNLIINSLCAAFSFHQKIRHNYFRREQCRIFNMLAELCCCFYAELIRVYVNRSQIHHARKNRVVETDYG